MNRKIHATIGWILALVIVAQNVGDCCGLVLCVEADGTSSIETPAQQADCAARHRAERETLGSAAGSKLTTPPGCVDIPLRLSGGVFTTRIERVAVPRLMVFGVGCWLPIVSQTLPKRSAQPGRNGIYDPSPPSLSLAALQSVILLI
jgi:hypothetical protein